MTCSYEAFWQAFARGEWEPATRDWIRRALAPGDLFVDIGAWIGPVSVWALERGARVIAVEPDPVASDELCRMLAPAIDSGVAEVWEGAIVADWDEDAYLAPDPRAGGELGDSQSRLGVELPGARRVAAWTLPDLLAGRVPRAVKIDVEGYETRLAPVIVPWLLQRGASVQVSIHGELPDLVDYEVTFLPDLRWGDLRLGPIQ